LALILILCVLVIEFFDGLGELCVDLNELLEGLLQEVVFLLQLVHPAPQLQQLILVCEVVLEFLGHPALPINEYKNYLQIISFLSGWLTRPPSLIISLG
jgi:hypothetical protein